MRAHEVRIRIQTVCTACGKPTESHGCVAENTGDQIKLDYPEGRTDQNLMVSACEGCFVFKADRRALIAALAKLEDEQP
jgi:hypothetical protein